MVSFGFYLFGVLTLINLLSKTRVYQPVAIWFY